MNTLIVRYVLTCGLFLHCTSLLSQEIDYKGFPEWSWHNKDSTEYYLYTPLNVKQGEKYPVVLFLHGCCGQDYHATLRNAVDPPVRMWHNFGANEQRIPTYLISPKTSRGWSQHIENLKAVIDELISSGKGDPQRIYITGFSMGGAGTWEFLNRYPNYFAAALPMGMDFHGDPEKVKHIPIWTNKGETDWFARSLNKQVTVLRTLNGDLINLDANWQTGVNPIFTEFKGVGHGVQWIATSTQDLVGWAYSKVNDGNKYPNVYFKSPSYKKQFNEGDDVTIDIWANDPDGSIEKVELLVNDKVYKTITREPFTTKFKMTTGDIRIEARAYDNKGKTSSTSTLVKTDIKTEFITNKLPFGTQGGYYEKQLFAWGNGDVQFELSGNEKLPDGLVLSNGLIKGIPVEVGIFSIEVKAKDEDRNDEVVKKFTLEIKSKQSQDVVISGVKNYKGESFPLAKVKLGESLWRNGDGEVSFSEITGYESLTFIQPDANDTSNVGEYLTFTVDEPIIMYVAYERKDKLFKSTIPDWLEEFNKEPGKQIVAQYFYYDVYSKDFPTGLITLPDAYENQNGVNTNYFVMIKKEGKLKKAIPLINVEALPDAKVNLFYREKLTCLNTSGTVTWKITSGKIANGLSVNSGGLISGIPQNMGEFSFTVVAEDHVAKTSSKKELVLLVK